MSLQDIDIDEIPLGKPLPWAIYDRGGRLLFDRGQVLPGREALAGHAGGGLLADLDASVEALKTMTGMAVPAEADERPTEELFPPGGVKPQIWDRVQIRLPGTARGKILYSHLIGYVKGTTILLTLPRDGEHWVSVPEGEMVEVRNLTGNHIYVFRSEVLRVSLGGVPYMHLRYPLQVQRQQLRRAPWAKTSLAVTVTAADGHRAEGHITNLSSSGAHLAAYSRLGGKDDALRLAFRVECGAATAELELGAVIRREAEGSEAGLLEYGVEFQGLAEETVLWLKCMVYERIAEGYLT
ncbi:MAG: flagellar brake protein [Sulfuricellaceae bacterium]|jgi:c-di-GMP-binding flagellar brake protein YcgR